MMRRDEVKRDRRPDVRTCRIKPCWIECMVGSWRVGLVLVEHGLSGLGHGDPPSQAPDSGASGHFEASRCCLGRDRMGEIGFTAMPNLDKIGSIQRWAI